MPRLSQERLDQLLAAEAQRDELLIQLDDWERSEGVAQRVHQALGEATVVNAIREDAETQALVEVTAEETVRLKKELAEGIKRDKYDDLAAEVRTTKGPEIIKDLKSLFETDGTFDGLRAEAERDVRAQIQQEVLDEERANVRAALEDPEQIEALKARMREDLLGSTQLDEFREGCVRELRQGWNEEVRDDAQAQIEVEEAAREDEYKQAKKAEWLDSSWARDLRERLRRSLQEEWSAKTKEEVAEAINDEVLKALLEEKAQLAREQVAREVRAEKLLRAFENEGVGVANFEPGTRIEIYLGTRKIYEVDGKDRSGYNIKVKKQGVACRRKLTLLARKDETFIVDDDSLLSAESEYARDNAIHRGTIITIGRRVSHNGETTLEHVVAAGVPLYYDDDASEPHITDAKYPVADIKIDGLSARGIEHVEML